MRFSLEIKDSDRKWGGFKPEVGSSDRKWGVLKENCEVGAEEGSSEWKFGGSDWK